MFKKLALLLPLGLCALPAAAATDGFLDVYYIPSVQLKTSGGSESSTGYGAKFAQPVISPLFVVTGQYQHESFDSGSLNQYRVGGGVQSSPDRARLLAYAEYVRDQFTGGGPTLGGFGLHARVTYTLIDEVDLYGEVGYVRITGDSKTFDGPELTGGVVWNFTPQLGAFADYRMTRTDANGGDEARFYETRTGLRLN